MNPIKQPVWSHHPIFVTYAYYYVSAPNGRGIDGPVKTDWNISAFCISFDFHITAMRKFS